MIRKEGSGEKTTRNFKSPRKREKTASFMSDREKRKQTKQPTKKMGKRTNKRKRQSKAILILTIKSPNDLLFRDKMRTCVCWCVYIRTCARVCVM